MEAQPKNVPAAPPSIPDHELLRPIASGSYGEVWLARNVVGTLRAVKIVRRDRHASVESFAREYKGLQKFEPVSRSHDGLVDILTLGLLLDGAGFYYVMELADGLESNKCSVISNQSPARIVGGGNGAGGGQHDGGGLYGEEPGGAVGAPGNRPAEGFIDITTASFPPAGHRGSKESREPAQRRVSNTKRYRSSKSGRAAASAALVGALADRNVCSAKAPNTPGEARAIPNGRQILSQHTWPPSLSPLAAF